MIDLNDLRTRPDAYRDAAKKKRLKIDIDAFLKLDEERRTLLHDVEKMRAEKNKVSAEVPKMKGDEKAKAVAAMKELSTSMKQKEEKLALIEAQWLDQQLRLPGIPLPQVPEGKDDTENKQLRTWGELRTGASLKNRGGSIPQRPSGNRVMSKPLMNALPVRGCSSSFLRSMISLIQPWSSTRSFETI
jgi:seryl-tRNA synthetase